MNSIVPAVCARLQNSRNRLCSWAAAIALLLLGSRTTQADTNIITASFASLKSAVAAGGTVVLNFDGTINTTNSLVISNNTVLLTFTNNVTINGGVSNRLFQVLSNASLTISNLTLSGGHSISTNGLNGGNGTTKAGGSQGTTGGAGAAGIDGLGGAVFNQGTLRAYTCIFLTNTATGSSGGTGGNGGTGTSTQGNGGAGGAGGSAYGGAIYNLGTLLLSNCTVAGCGVIGGTGGTGGAGGTNASLTSIPGAGGAGGVAYGAGVYNRGMATLVGCTFAFNFSEGGNSQAAGPPQANQNGTTGPTGGGSLGGGFYNLGTNTLINCTFDQNVVVGGAGGNGGNAPGGFDGGKGGNGGAGLGGGYYNEAGALVNVTNCTFAEGTVTGGTNGLGGTGPFANGVNGSPGQALGANLYNNGGTFNLKNSIVAYPTNGFNVAGTFIDLNNNISSDTSPTFTQTNSFTNSDPLLIGLNTNGGPTLTMELPAGSPAIDAIFDGSAPALDQRGFSRNQFGARPDIGAVEFGTFAITGRVLFASNGAGDPSVVISVNNTNVDPAQTDTNGNFTLGGLSAGTYTFTPTQSGFTFTPTNIIVTLPSTTNNIAFVASVASFTISGQITILGTSTPFTNTAFVIATGTNAANTFTNQTDANGNYIFPNLPTGTYTVAPAPIAGVTFASTNTTTVSVPPGTNINFTASISTSTVSGRVTLGGNAFTNAVLIVSGTNSLNVVQSFTNTTDANGNYSFASLADGTYVIAPQAVVGVSFSPVSSPISIPPGASGVNFAGTLVLSTISGQISLGTNGTAYPNVTVVAAGTNAFNSVTNYSAKSGSGGAYSLINLPAGTYVLTPQPAGYYSPAKVTLTLPPSTNINFNDFTFTNSALAISSQPNSSLVKLTFTQWVTNLTYRIQASTDLVTWQDINSVTPGSNNAIVPVSTSGFTNRFFRAVSP